MCFMDFLPLVVTLRTKLIFFDCFMRFMNSLLEMWSLLGVEAKACLN